MNLLKILLFKIATVVALMRKSLNQIVIPIHYDLYINVSENTFSGRVKIECHPNKPVDVFQLNSQGLNLKEILLGNVELSHSQEDDVVTINLPKTISDNFPITINYTGKYSEGMEGFYKSNYKGNPIFSTHFEPTDARKAFPCFDQPDMKATFSISLKVPEGFMALSNNQLISQEDQLYVFDTTPKMSTYIVAFVVGKLSYIESGQEDLDGSYKKFDQENFEKSDLDESHKKAKFNKHRIPIRVYADESEVQYGKFALDIAVRSLSFYEKYFEIDYPLPKLDMVAIPSFAMGAMENWGLVTYRSSSLLYDEKTTAMRSKKNIAITVAHELAHMWFGNLVTMAWWSDLWLNEGFATWAATLALFNNSQDIIPWDSWVSFINDDVEAGMSMDALRSTHKIGVEVEDPVEIDQIFDAISYSKGSSIIKMVENWLGPEVFRKGLVMYLKKFSYSNCSTIDLCVVPRVDDAYYLPGFLGRTPLTRNFTEITTH